MGRVFLCRGGLWNLVGAGIFGFKINPPINLYYMQGLNDGGSRHGALYGVYGVSTPACCYSQYASDAA
ncbi:MAG: hypothetical protein IPG58_17320 [Acidobacteria bacterium]|nr:hypothetical protein [Acidobacteriota bacterium]